MNIMDKKAKFRVDVARGRKFEVCERAEWAHEAEKLDFEASTEWKDKSGRIDIKINEEDGSISIVELKATDWDRIKRSRIRTTALRHARQVWRYVNDAVLTESREVCAGVVYEREPSDEIVREEVEAALNERLLQVVWRTPSRSGDIVEPAHAADAQRSARQETRVFLSAEGAL